MAKDESEKSSGARRAISVFICARLYRTRGVRAREMKRIPSGAEATRKFVSTRCERKLRRSLSGRLDVEAEEQDIAVFDNVVFAFEAILAGLFDGRFAL